MNVKLNKIAIIFLILMLVIPISSFNVGATESMITNLYTSSGEENKYITVRSDGVMFSAILNIVGNNVYIRIHQSTDNGATWVQNGTTSCGSISSADRTSICMGVDKDDTIHVFWVGYDSYRYRLNHYYLEDGGTWTSGGTIMNTGIVNFVSYGCDVDFDSENMYLTWSYTESGTLRLYYRAYNFMLSTWGSQYSLTSGTKPDAIKYNSDIYVFCESGSNIKYSKLHNSNHTWTHNYILVSDGSYTYGYPKPIVYNNKLYVFYQGNSVSNANKQILYKTSSGSSWSSENVICSDTGYDQLYPTASVSSNGKLNVVWSGRSSISSAYYQLRQCVYQAGSWGDVAYITSGSSQKYYPDLCFQDYPAFTWLTDGVCIGYCAGNVYYIDSGSLIWYSGDGEGEYQGDFEFDANNNIGSLDTQCILDFNKKDVEFKYQVPTTINATGFDLLVSNAMHDVASDLSNYDFYINGEPMGNPTEWKQYGSQYVLRWTFSEDKVITNSEILFEVWHDQLVSGINYWQIGVSCAYNDLDGDGIALLKYSNTYPNGVYDGSYMDKDVAYQLYYNVIQFVEDETDIQYNSISLTNGSFYVGDPVSLTYSLKSSDMVYDNYVRIWNNDTATEISLGSMQGFPYLCTQQVETIGFVPFTSANYTANLYVNGISVDDVSFYVDEQVNANMSVFTYPNPSNVGQKIWVSYKFIHPTGKDGAIFVSMTPDLNNYISISYLSSGDTGFWTTTHDNVGIYYYIMAVDIDGNGTYGIVNNGIHTHYIKSEHGNNFFTARWSNLKLDIDGTTTQTVNGECNMVSGNCFIYDNNKLVKTITESPFSYSYEVHTAGLHSIEMRLITNVTTVLCTQNYTVSTYTGEEDVPQDDSEFWVRDWIIENYGDIGVFVAGISIIFGCMLIPFFVVLHVNVTYNKNIALGDLHWSIYIIFAMIGVIVTVQLHLADVWIVLLLCVVAFAIAVVTYNSNK